jgi:hypothetical protein
MPAKNKRYVIPFEDGRAAFAVQLSSRADAADAARALGFTTPRPTIYVTGGAGMMSPEDIRATQTLVERGLVRFAETYDVAVIDGGTEAGIPIMLGAARRKRRSRFPLIGIAPLELVRYGSHNADKPDAALLNTGHSHFVLTAGDEFGDESEIITQMTHVLSGEGQQPALGVLINGGKIAREEVYARTTSSELSFPLIVIEGSGRFADMLARAFFAGRTEEEDIQAIISRGRLDIVSIKAGPNQLFARLMSHFNAFKPAARV